MLYKIYQITSGVLYGLQYNRQYCTLRAFGQFGALYMHKYKQIYNPTGYKSTAEPNEPSTMNTTNNVHVLYHTGQQPGQIKVLLSAEPSVISGALTRMN